MDYKIDDIIKLLVKDNYLTPLNGEFLKTKKDSIDLCEIYVDNLRENLNISLSASKLTPRNIRDFKSLLDSIQNVTDKVLAVRIVEPHKAHRTIYVDCSLKKTFDEL